MSEPWKVIEEMLREIIQGQELAAFKCAQRIVPHLTTEDMLQPNDFRELETHAAFRYEEGVLAGLQTAESALRALKRDLEEAERHHQDDSRK